MTSPQSDFSGSSALAWSKRPSMASRGSLTSRGSQTSGSSYGSGNVPMSPHSPRTPQSPSSNPSIVTFNRSEDASRARFEDASSLRLEDASRPRLSVVSHQSILKKPNSHVSGHAPGLAAFRFRRQSSLSKGSGVDDVDRNKEPQHVQQDFARSEEASVFAHQNISVELPIPPAYNQLMHHDPTSGTRVMAFLLGFTLVMVAAAALYYYVRAQPLRGAGPPAPTPRPVLPVKGKEKSSFDKYCVASGSVDSNLQPGLPARAEDAYGKKNGFAVVSVVNNNSAIAQEHTARQMLVRESKSLRFKVTTEPLPFSNITLWNTSNPKSEFGHLNVNNTKGGKPRIRSIQLDRLATATPSCLKHPYVALIRFDSANCSGSLVDDRVVLTSASCFMSRRPRDQDIMQTTDFVPESQNVTVHLIFAQPGLPCTVRSWQAAAVYVHTLDDERDIAVVLLQSDNMSVPSLSPTCLAAQSDDLPDQPFSCEVIDFFASGSTSSSTLGPQVENSPTWSLNFKCSGTVVGYTNHSLVIFLADKYCCKAGDSLGRSLCGGDSGGILMCTPKGQRSWKQFGIVPPSARAQADLSSSSLFWATSVVYHRQWLELMALPMLRHFEDRPTRKKKLLECQFSLCLDWIAARSLQSESSAPSSNSRARATLRPQPRSTRRRRQFQSNVITTTDQINVVADNDKDYMTRSAICRWLQGYLTCRRSKSQDLCDILLNILHSKSEFRAYDSLLKTFNGDEHLTACNKQCSC